MTGDANLGSVGTKTIQTSDYIMINGGNMYIKAGMIDCQGLNNHGGIRCADIA